MFFEAKFRRDAITTLDTEDSVIIGDSKTGVQEIRINIIIWSVRLLRGST